MVVGLAAVLVGVAIAVGLYLNRDGSGVVIFAPAPPLFGHWLPHVGPGTPLALLVAFAVIGWGPALAAKLPWHGALSLSYLAALCWTLALALVDGWTRGFTHRLDHPTEYLHEVPGITDIPAMVQTFADRILQGRPDSWTTHVSGHPPGATLVFVWLDRLGLSGGTAASWACVLVGCLVAVAVPVTVRALGSPAAARAMLPFAVLFPGAVWIAVSADALFAGVTASAIAVLALSGRAFAERARSAIPLAVIAGVLLGFGIFLSYGLVLLGVLALAVVLASRSGRALAWALVGALSVVAAFALAGFWWLDGYHLVVERYYQGIASERPFAYWVWANVACLAIAVGPAVVVAMRRGIGAGARTPIRRWDGALVLGGAALLMIVAADVSGLSKAEVERIWLPFTVWLLPLTALLPPPTRRWWLAGQAVVALTVNHLVLTVW
ncbi:hypothetical protein SAMN05216266_113115 [Amycolatopsis marina]|uniref:Integral membrane protein n=1 Tax=Amycolatopsis marina TaxID=490629 RepID=A0A1I1BIF7_9PSEU|nr:hypothetical protein SAMN05216266_113115 [Amycolatopsis marina]